MAKYRHYGASAIHGFGSLSQARHIAQQILHAALAAVPWLLACSGLRGKDRGRRTSGTLVLCAATSRSDHNLACGEDASSQIVV